MNTELFPKTRFGKLSFYLVIAFLFFLTIGMTFSSLGQEGGETIFDNPFLSIPMILAGLCIVGGFFTGIYSIWKKERSLIVYVVTFIGFLVTLFLLGEFIFPH